MATNSYTDVDVAVVNLTATVANKISNVVEDLTPQLGGDLDGQGNIVSNVELKDYSETLVDAVMGGEGSDLIMDYSLGNVFKITLSQDVLGVFIQNPPVAGKAGSVTLQIQQDFVTPRTVAWGTSFKWAGDVVPVITPTVVKGDLFTFTTFDGGITWLSFVAGQDFDIPGGV